MTELNIFVSYVTTRQLQNAVFNDMLSLSTIVVSFVTIRRLHKATLNNMGSLLIMKFSIVVSFANIRQL